MTTTISTRIDVEKKEAAETLFNGLGLSLSAAINLFITKALDFRGIPFEIRETQPKSTVLDEAIAEARKLSRNPKTKRYHDVDELLADALK